MIQRPHNRKGGMAVSMKNLTQGGRMSVGRQKGQRRPVTPTNELPIGDLVSNTKAVRPTT